MVSIPRSPALAVRNQPDWGPAYAIDLPLTSAYVHTGGSLCIDLVGVPDRAAPGLWPVDFALEPLRGTLFASGRGCGAWLGAAATGLAGQPATLVPGSTTRLVTWAQPGSLAFFMLGSQDIPGGLPLDGLGAPGCALFVEPWVTLGRVLSQPAQTDRPGHAALALHLPMAPTLMGGELFVQAAAYELRAPFSNAAHLTTSHGLCLKIARGLPTLDAAAIQSAPRAPAPAFGAVDAARMPALRLY